MCYYYRNSIPKDRGAVVKSSLCVRVASVAQGKGAAAEEKRGARFSGHGENISVAVAKAESYYGSGKGWMYLRPLSFAIIFGYPSGSRFFLCPAVQNNNGMENGYDEKSYLSWRGYCADYPPE